MITWSEDSQLVSQKGLGLGGGEQAWGGRERLDYCLNLVSQALRSFAVGSQEPCTVTSVLNLILRNMNQNLWTGTVKSNNKPCGEQNKPSANYPVDTGSWPTGGSLVLILFQDLADRVAASLRGCSFAFQNSLSALVAHGRAAGEGNQAGILTAGRWEHWEVREERDSMLKMASLSWVFQ